MQWHSLEQSSLYVRAHLQHELAQHAQLVGVALRQRQQPAEGHAAPVLVHGMRCRLPHRVGRTGVHLARCACPSRHSVDMMLSIARGSPFHPPSHSVTLQCGERMCVYVPPATKAGMLVHAQHRPVRSGSCATSLSVSLSACTAAVMGTRFAISVTSSRVCTARQQARLGGGVPVRAALRGEVRAGHLLGQALLVVL